MEHEGDDNTNCGWYTWNNPQRIGKGKLGNKITNGDDPNNSIMIAEYWEESKSLRFQWKIIS